MTALFRLIQTLVDNKFFGEVQVTFERGCIVKVKKIESFDVEQFK